MKFNSQKILFESIHKEYSSHYFDKLSMKYRDIFICKYLLKELDLNNKKVIELASGSRKNSKALLGYFPDVDTCGCDI